ERRRQRADAERARGEHEVLARGDHGVRGTVVDREREDHGRRVLHLAGELRGRAMVLVLRRNLFELRPLVAFVASLRPPGFVVEWAELVRDLLGLGKNAEG